MLVGTLRWNTPPFGQLAAEMDRLFDTVLAGAPLPQAAARPGFPALNGWEDEQAVYVEAELPGVPMDKLEVTVQGDELTIKGERPAPQGEQSWVRQERWHGSFERTVTLPTQVEAEKVAASLVNGVLTITLPKAASARARRIAIQGVAR